MTTPKYNGGGSTQDLVNAAGDASVAAVLEDAKGLRDFLMGIDQLSKEERDLIVDQAIVMLEGFYVHLPLKRAMHAVDPLQRLRLLKRRLPQLTSEIAFHHEMTNIFTSLRDLHTNYLLPTHFARVVAFLPFRVEACMDQDKRTYIVTNIPPGFSHPKFVKGVTITYWNGIPIERAVEIAASYHAGSNADARHARGVAGLTKRAMIVAPPPDEEWLVVGYKDLDGNPRELRIDWAITGLPPESDGAPEAVTEAATAFGLDLEGDIFGRVNKMLFAQKVIAAKRRIQGVRRAARDRAMAASVAGFEGDPGTDSASAEAAEAINAVNGLESTLPDFFTAKVVQHQGRSCSYIRIHTFSTQDDVAFVNEFMRLIELPDMPKDGLIIDVRANPGGLIWAGERLLQLLTPKIIEPCRVQFINSELTRRLVSGVKGLAPWAPAMQRALESGAIFSSAFPITPPERCNDIGQRYYGPVVLITDALCYSTTDFFSAGFQDHGIGVVLGTDAHTGAGGANVWTLDTIQHFFGLAGLPPPLLDLPKGAGMRVAIRRALRVGPEAGTELEDFGVERNVPHQLTRNDLLNGNQDLINHACSLLAAATPRRFKVNANRAAGKISVGLDCDGVDWVDVYVGGRCRNTRNVPNGVFNLELSGNDPFALPGAPALLEFRGFAAGELVCLRRLSV